MKRPIAAFLASVLVLASASSTFAEPAPATRLDYQRAPGAETCPDADAWTDAVVSKVEGAADPFTPNGANVLRVTMERRANGFRAAFEVFDAAGRSQGTQEQTAPTCAEAASALALGASLLFVARPSPAPTSPPPAFAPPIASPPLSKPLQPPPPSSRWWRVQVGAGAGGALGFSPSVAPGFAGFVGMRFALREGEGAPAFSVSLEGRGDLESTGSTLSGPQGQTAQVHAAFGGATLAPCGHGRWFLGCALFTLGEVRANIGANVPDQGALFVGLGARVGAEFPFLRGPFTLAGRVALDGWFSIVRPEVAIEGTPVWTAPQGAGVLGAYLVALF